jgi:hypothetical protein
LAVRPRTGILPRRELIAERRTRRPSRAADGEGDHPRWAAGAAGANPPAYGERNASRANEATGERCTAEMVA